MEVEAPQENLVSPFKLRTPIMGGTKHIEVHCWRMALQDECWPIVMGMLDRFTDPTAAMAVGSLGELISSYKDECTRICKMTVGAELEAQKIDWDRDLHGEDLFVISQAIWDTSIKRPDGGGLVGKTWGVLEPHLAGNLAILLNQARVGRNQAPSPPKTSSAPETQPSTDG